MSVFVKSILDIPIPNIVLGGVAIIGAIFFSSIIVSTAIYDKKTEYDSDMSKSEEYKEEEYKKEARELKQHKAKYGQNWFTELEQLEHKTLTSEEIVDLRNKIVNEDTPEGSVIMYYNSDTESFWYYSNTKNISNRTLDAVARKYSITHRCKEICVNHRAEIRRVQDKLFNMLYTNDNNIPESNTDDKVKNNIITPSFNIEDVFVKPKVSKKNLIKRHRRVIVDRVNRFSYKGKLEDYKWIAEREEGAREDANNDRSSISFQEYKDSQLKKKTE